MTAEGTREGRNSTPPRDVTIDDLLSLIDGLDAIEADAYLELSEWNRQGMGETQQRLSAVVRKLARERLATFSTEDVGMEVIRRIDQRKALYEL